jgi:hypothetical protein
VSRIAMSGSVRIRNNLSVARRVPHEIRIARGRASGRRCLGFASMSFAKWTLIAACVLTVTACSSGSGKSGSTTTTNPAANAGTIADKAWHQVAQGTFARRTWKISSARSSGGFRCYDIQGLTSSATTTTVAGAPTRNGAPVTCVPPASNATGPKFVAFVNGADGNNWVLVGAVADGTKHVKMAFAGGSSTPLNIDPKSKLVIWKGPASLKPKEIRADTTTCPIGATPTTHSTALCAGVGSGS